MTQSYDPCAPPSEPDCDVPEGEDTVAHTPEASANVDADTAGASAGLTQAGSGSAYRVAGSENIADVGQAESYINTNLRRTANMEEYDQAIRSINLLTVTEAQARAQLAQADAQAFATRAQAEAQALATRVQHLEAGSDNRVRAIQEDALGKVAP